MGVSDLIQRLRDEFTAMPGLLLTEPQVERLCTADASTSASALQVLVSTGFLSPTPDGQYGRTDVVARVYSSPLVGARTGPIPAPWRRILCVVDLACDRATVLSAAARSALRYATTLAVTHRARITALQVTSRSASAPATTAASDTLRSIVVGEHFRGLIDVQVACGALTEEVTRAAQDIHADLIVIGCSARRDDGSLSRISETLRQAPCPVLIVHPSGRAAVA